VKPFGSQWRFPVAGATVALIGSGCAVVLILTNPKPDEYADHAGQQLVGFLTQELCRSDGLPMLLQMWVRDCPQLVASQQQALAHLAARFTTRLDLGVASVYTTRLGGQDLAPGFTLPRLKAVTLAAAGQFVMLRSESDNGSLE
tara:strand:- start:1848 stop:2279 length:432 start_codon:yes stop_codon:yes gene_type:complete